MSGLSIGGLTAVPVSERPDLVPDVVRSALAAPMHVIFRMELAPASVTTIQWWPDGTPALRGFSVVPE